MIAQGAAAARRSMKENARATWSARTPNANALDALNASNRIGQGALEIGIAPKFAISASKPVFALGSCFAREIEEALDAAGLEVPTLCDDLFGHPLLRTAAKEGGALRPRSYLNRYNTMSMLSEVRHLLGCEPGLEAGRLIYPVGAGTAADLHYSQALPQVDVARSIERRALVRARLGDAIRGSSLFVLTLGLAEAWYDVAERIYLNNTPGPRVMAAFADRLEVHLTDFGQHLEALETLHDALAGVAGTALRIVVTVSPVPLEKTFFGWDVISTNSYSKSMLRAAAHAFACNHANVDYFPSYEIVTGSARDIAWNWDQRHVPAPLVRHITDTFCRHYLNREPVPPGSGP